MMSWTMLEGLVDSVPTADLGIKADSSCCTHTHTHTQIKVNKRATSRGHVLPRISKLPKITIKVPREWIESMEPSALLSITLVVLRCHKTIDLHSTNSQNLFILGNLEIQGRTCPREVACLVTLTQMHYESIQTTIWVKLDAYIMRWWTWCCYNVEKI